MAECTTLDSLLEMGFDRNRAEKAVAHTGNQGIERAMDWLMEHENDPDIDEPYVSPAGNTLGTTEEQSQSPTEPPEPSEVAEQEGDPKQPISEEERKEQVKRLEELMKIRQEERRERERKEEIEREKQRRKQGQELLHVKQKLQDDEMKKLADQRRREKMEDRLAKQRVKEKIARDREERARKVRLLDGSTMSTVFKAQEPLAAVRVYVQMNGANGQDFNLITPYPRRVFTDLDMEKPLSELGLVPSAVLVVIKK
ncbi:UBX domain-containing protein 1 isoform X2 [Carassius auratus]|uniref:UBX domain-containing protein 1 isoform X2 n=1 Tax=Carassius auratus TaxID=7957 RepID=A0A6P6NU53_CARAU|nr:UBX domain-containing protein 1 isoform X2 [Carassius auratus]